MIVSERNPYRLISANGTIFNESSILGFYFVSQPIMGML
jgi:hypothetical protein